MKRPTSPTTALQLPAAPPERLVGGRYALGRMLGRGGNCEVYEATHAITGRRVALKLLRPEQREDRDARLRLAQEARALASIQHPNFMEILDAEIEGQPEPFLALELLEGSTLEHVLESQSRLGVAESVRWMRQITGAVAELHHAGWLHRDLKPANVLLVGEGNRANAKVLDLGIAVAVNAEIDTRLTTRGTILGTVPYMAPEQVWGDGQIDARTDVWQLGATLYDMLTGEVPFPGEYPQVLVQMSRGRVPSVRCLRPDVPVALERIVARALALRPADRFADADALLAALVAFEASLERVDEEPLPVSGTRLRLRAQLLAPVRALLEGAAAVDLRTEDICSNGLRVVGSQPLPEGAVVRLRMSLPISNRLVNVPCLVRSVEVRRGPTGTPRAFAMTLEFDASEAELRREAAHYVEALGA